MFGLQLPAINSSPPPTGRKGNPMSFNRSSEKFTALDCESGWSSVQPMRRVLQNVIVISLIGTDKLQLPLNPSSESMHGMYMWCNNPVHK